MGRVNLLLGLSNLACATLSIVAAVPLVQRKVKMNRWYGVRIKKALESDDNWYQINAYASKRLILWALVLAGIGILTFFIPLQHPALRFLLACAPLILVVPYIEAQIFARRL
ncbi:MAG: SdpI family protein [Sedimentisphaerales bacterium]|nr:SdpI family protein [Sedimentisphaerales bacterium]